jgi:hypothetical protein
MLSVSACRDDIEQTSRAAGVKRFSRNSVAMNIAFASIIPSLILSNLTPMYAYRGLLIMLSPITALLQLNVRRCAALEKIDAALNI